MEVVILIAWQRCDLVCISELAGADDTFSELFELFRIVLGFDQ